MNTATTADARREQKLNAILLALVKALERGETPDRQEYLAAHPEFADEIAEFFAGRDCLRRLTAGQPAGRNPSGPATDLGRLGDFRLLREVGRGGMGIVYEAQQISLDRGVALKVLPFAAALDARQLQRFKNEAHAAALLHHPHIVPIYAVGCDEGVHYYAMQFIQGRSLAGLIAGLREPYAEQSSRTAVTGPRPAEAWQSLSAPEPPAANPPPTITSAGMATARSTWRSDYFRRAARLGIEAAEALHHAHQLGVVHRDIKPANLLLDMHSHLWITDFGVALLKSSQGGMTTTGELVGTLRYMSPEQAGAERGLVDHRTDIYSLGATLYELLALEPAFPGADPSRLLHQIATEDPCPPRTRDRSIPVELELIVLKAMAKCPSERYATAQELADDLKRFLEDQPVRATPPSLLDRAVKWSRRHKAVVLSALVLLVLATVGLSISTVLIGQSHGVATAAYEREKVKTQEAEQQRLRAEKNLAHARRVVAFLTQVSAEELSDVPEFLPVRQKLLTAALQYYQQFIDEHQDDPSIRAELDASHAHVQQILTVLTAQQEYTQLMLRSMLLGEWSVQTELRMSPSQKERLRELGQQLIDHRREVLKISLKLSAAERGKEFKDLAAANEKVLATILTPQQTARLKQIAVQQHGVHAFDVPEVVAALGLTADQKSRIRPQLVEAARSQKEIYANEADPGKADRQAMFIGKQTEKKIVALFTPQQETTWRELTGELFNGHIAFKPKPGFGPPGPPPPHPPPHEMKGPPPEDGPPPEPPFDEWWKGKKDGGKKKKF